MRLRLHLMHHNNFLLLCPPVYRWWCNVWKGSIWSLRHANENDWQGRECRGGGGGRGEGYFGKRVSAESEEWCSGSIDPGIISCPIPCLFYPYLPYVCLWFPLKLCREFSIIFQALGGDLVEPDTLLCRQLETLYHVFAFYHGSIDHVRRVSRAEAFVNRHFP